MATDLPPPLELEEFGTAGVGGRVADACTENKRGEALPQAASIHVDVAERSQALLAGKLMMWVCCSSVDVRKFVQLEHRSV